MKNKALKIAAITLGSVIGLIIVAMIAIPYFFKDKIIAAALDAANESLTAKIVVEPSDINFSLFSDFPNFTLSAKNFSIEGTGKFEGTKLISTPEMYAVVDIMSVFSGSPTIREVGVKSPVINIVTAKDGSANYDIVKPSDAAPEESPSDTSSVALNIDLKKYGITDATVNYTDSTSAMEAHIGGFTHTGSGSMRSQQFALSTVTRIDTVTFAMDGTKYVKDARITGDITLDVDMDKMVFTVDTKGEKYNLSLNGIDLLCEGSVAMLDGGGMDLDVRLGSGKTEFSSLLAMLPPQYAKMLDGVKTQGTFETAGTVKGVYGENKMPAIDLLLKAENGRIQYPSLPKSIDDINIDVRVVSPQSSSLDAMTVNMSKCTMAIAGSPLTATMFLSTPISDPDIKAALKTKLDIASLRDVMPLEKDDKVSGTIDADVSIAGRLSTLEKGNYEAFKADGSVNINNMVYATKSVSQPVEIPRAQLIFSPKALDLRALDLKIGNSDLSLKGALENYLAYYLKGKELKGNLKVSSTNLDLSSLMPADSTATASAPAKTENKAENGTADTHTSPITLPKNIKFDTELDLKKVSYDGIDVSDIKGHLGLYDQIAYLQGITMKVADGKVNASGSYNAKKPENAEVDMKFGLSSLDIPALADMFPSVKKIAPVAGSVSGRVSGQVNLGTRLDKTMSPVYNTMNSKGELKTADLELKNSQFTKSIGTALGIKALENDPKVSDLNLSYTISEGKLTIAPTSFKVAGIDTKLSGGMNLEGFNLDMLADLKVPRKMLPENINQTIDKAVSALSSLGVKTSVGETLDIATLITGPATSPKYGIAYGPDHSPSLGDYLKSETQKAAEKAKEEVKAKAEEKIQEESEKLKDKASEALKGLFKKKS